ncbi:MAG TPA: AsmA-like C-terminal region-containing protein, partial [Candidatus Binatia bacterium]|nr:AsmA-like C-terminal region-containing protein [Candidatus Binatia bacterium]
QLRWLPLLTGRLRIEKFILDEPEIQIIKNEAGQLNLAAFAAAREQKPVPHEESAGAAARGRRSSGAPRLLITDFNIRNGSIDYIDRTGREPVEVRIRRLNLTASGALDSPAKVTLGAEMLEGQGRNLVVEGEAGPMSGRPWTQTPLNLKIRCESLLLAQLVHAIPSLRPVLSGYIAASGPMAFDARLEGTIERPHFKDLNLSAAFFGAATNNTAVKGDIDFSRAEWRENGAIKLRLTIDQLPLDQLKTLPFFAQALPPALLMDGPVSVSADVDGNLAALGIKAAVKASQSEIVYGNWIKKSKGVAADLILDMERRKEKIIFRNSILTVSNAKIKFTGAIEELTYPRLLVDVSAEGFPLATVEKLLLPLSGYNLAGTATANVAIVKSLNGESPLEIRGTVALEKLQAKERRSGRGIDGGTGQIVFRGREARFERVALRSGTSDVALEGAIADISNPTLRYSLRSIKLKAADFRSAIASKDDEMKSIASSGELGVRNGKPWLRANVASTEGKLADVPYRNLRAEIAWAPQTFELKNLTLQALGGNVRGGGAWEETQGNAVRVAVDPNIDGVDLRSLFKQKSFGLEDHLDGRFSLKGKFRAAAKTSSGLPQELTGAGDMQVRGGALKDFNLLRLVFAQILGGSSRRWPQRIGTLAERKDTLFDTLAGNFTIQERRVYSKRVSLSGPDYSVEG